LTQLTVTPKKVVEGLTETSSKLTVVIEATLPGDSLTGTDRQSTLTQAEKFVLSDLVFGVKQVSI
jgi:hypothetical protein